MPLKYSSREEALEAKKAQTAEFHARNPGKRAEYRAKNKATHYAATQRWKQENKRKVAEYERLRRARKRGALQVVYNKWDIFERDGWVCQLCFTLVEERENCNALMGPTVDHIVALANGGDDKPDNVQLAHYSCNARKGSK